MRVNLTAGTRCRREWLDWLNARGLCADEGQSTRQIGPWLRWGRGGYGVSCERGIGASVEPAWIKWVPQAQPSEIETTCRRMQCWRGLHPKLAVRVPEMIDCWPEGRILVLDYHEGQPLQKLARNPGAGDRARLCGHLEQLGTWLQAFATGEPPYGPEADALLGEHGIRNSSGLLRVNARRQLTCRIDQGCEAVDRLVTAGYGAARQWEQRFDLNALLTAFGTDEAGGFMHGDLKPENVLVDADRFTVLDWWMTPSVSWPLPDAAVFLAHLRLCTQPAAFYEFAEAFLCGYFGKACDARVQTAMEVIMTVLLLRMADELLRRSPAQLLVRSQCVRLIRLALSPAWEHK